MNAWKYVILKNITLLDIS